MNDFTGPALGGERFSSIDAHTAGEPLRVITGGVPAIPGATMLAKRRWASQHLDRLRCRLMLEPRGHADMYGCILTEPVTPDGDLGVLFLHNEGFSTMCGHGIIGLVTVALECRLLELDPGAIRIDTPAGRVTAAAETRLGRVVSVSFENVASFVVARGLTVDVPGVGSVRYDLAFGGAYYAYLDAEQLGVGLNPGEVDSLISFGRSIKAAVAEMVELRYPGDGERNPEEGDLDFLYGTIFCGPAVSRGAHSRNVCVFADGEVDRSPTGTGVSGRAALEYLSGSLSLGEAIVVESILGTTFEVAVLREETLGTVKAVVPRVTGSAHVTGRHEFFVDPADPLQDGFVLR